METLNQLGIELACQRLAYRFCHLSDHRRFDDYATVFAADGVFSRPGLEAHGRPEILAAVRRRPDHLETRHLCTNVLVEVVDESHATGTGVQLYIVHDTTSQTTHTPVVVDFTDDYLLTPEGWKIARRSVRQAF